MPRPIELQRTAAQLIAHIPALKTIKHVGQICDVLADANIDVTRWAGRDIARELTTDTQSRGWVWPAQLTRPTAFLRWRLAQIDWSAPSPAERAHDNDRTRLAEQAARRCETREQDSHVAEAHTRAEIMQHIRKQLSTRTPACPSSPSVGGCKIFVIGKDQSSVIERDGPPMNRGPIPTHGLRIDDHVRVILDHHTGTCHGAAVRDQAQ